MASASRLRVHSPILFLERTATARCARLDDDMRARTRRRLAATALAFVAAASLPVGLSTYAHFRADPVAAYVLLDDSYTLTNSDPGAVTRVEPLQAPAPPLDDRTAPPDPAAPGQTATALPALEPTVPGDAPAVTRPTPAGPPPAGTPPERTPPTIPTTPAAMPAASPPPAETARVEGVEDVEGMFLRSLNGTRAAVGLGALRVDPQLVRLARGWAAKMAASGAISHNTQLADQISGPWQKLGENVGRGGDPEAIAGALVASATHYKNLVDPDFELVGIGVVKVDTTFYVAQEFQALRVDRRGSARALPAPAAVPSTVPPPSPGAPAAASDVLGASATRPRAVVVTARPRTASTSAQAAARRHAARRAARKARAQRAVRAAATNMPHPAGDASP